MTILLKGKTEENFKELTILVKSESPKEKTAIIVDALNLFYAAIQGISAGGVVGVFDPKTQEFYQISVPSFDKVQKVSGGN